MVPIYMLGNGIAILNDNRLRDSFENMIALGFNITFHIFLKHFNT
jgi:hypothetical protein